MSRPSFIPKHNTPERDIIMTPEPCAIDIISHFSPTGSILDPCRGEGAFYNNYPISCEKDWCELEEGKDFFTYDKKVDWIITNPPWSKIKEFIIHSMTIADSIVYLITINHFTTKHRMRLIYENNFGIKEFYCIKTPDKPWPQSGFQIAAVQFERGYTGDIKMNRHIG